MAHVQDMPASTIIQKPMIGKGFVHGSEVLSPVFTASPAAINEQPELRAYKLGKQKCSYNQLEIVFRDDDGEIKVSEAIETCVGAEVEECFRECCLKFSVRFSKNLRIYLYLYLVFADSGKKITSADEPCARYHWLPVTRNRCTKGCKGPVIRGLQRFGKLSKRAGTSESQESWKDPKNLYISIDEASTHVCVPNLPNVPRFRFLLAAYSQTYELLGTTVSSSIRVLSNNDAPLGAAFLKIQLNLKGRLRQGIGGTENVSSQVLAPIPDGGIPEREHQVRKKDPEAIFAKAISENASDPDRGKCPTKIQDETGQKHDSLTELCERLFNICKRKTGSLVSLRSLAAFLGARKRRIYEIFNVLQCIMLVEPCEGQEKYWWNGSESVSLALKNMKVSMQKEPVSRKLSRSEIQGRLSENCAENSIKDLALKFLQLFLHDNNRSITLEHAVDKIIDKHYDPQTKRSKIRRLTEIGKIFTALNLISVDNQKPYEDLSFEILYSWQGSHGVQERLHVADALKRRKLCEKPERVERPPHRKRKRMLLRDVASNSNSEEEGFCPLYNDTPIHQPRLCAIVPRTSPKDSATRELSEDSLCNDAAALLLSLREGFKSLEREHTAIDEACNSCGGEETGEALSFVHRNEANSPKSSKSDTSSEPEVKGHNAFNPSLRMKQPSPGSLLAKGCASEVIGEPKEFYQGRRGVEGKARSSSTVIRPAAVRWTSSTSSVHNLLPSWPRMTQC